MSATCAKCGDCCEVIGVPVAPEDFVQFLQYPESCYPPNNIKTPEALAQLDHDWTFMAIHWHPIRRAAAVAVNPRMDTPGRETHYFYTCDQFDAESRLCMAHDDRPKVCSDFPWYDYGPNNRTPASHLRCSYWADVPVEEWPEGVNPLVPVNCA